MRFVLRNGPPAADLHPRTAPGLVDDTGHPVEQAPADRLAETENPD